MTLSLEEHTALVRSVVTLGKELERLRTRVVVLPALDDSSRAEHLARVDRLVAEAMWRLCAYLWSVQCIETGTKEQNK